MPRVPAVYLHSAIRAILANLAIRKINNLRASKIRRSAAGLKDDQAGRTERLPSFALASASSGLLQYPYLTGVFTDRWDRDPTIDIIDIATSEKVSERDFLVWS